MPAAFSSLKLQWFSAGADSVAGILWIKDNTEGSLMVSGRMTFQCLIMQLYLIFYVLCSAKV